MHDILDIVMINTIRMDDILSISNLHKHYVRNGFFGKKLPPVKAVDGISFSIKPGNVLVLAGESGSGKSTIARLILGAEEADSGTIRFGGNKVDSLPDMLPEMELEKYVQDARWFIKIRTIQ